MWSGLPFSAEGSNTSSHLGMRASENVSVVSYVPRVPEPDVAVTTFCTSVFPAASNRRTSNVASNVFAVPRSRNGQDTVALHRICHAAIHATLSEKELERQYNTIERLREHPQLRRFIVWVRRKPPEFWVRTPRAR